MEGKRFLRSIELKNLLSYGPEGVKLELEPLNVLIGANATGKSNLIQALRLLQAAPNDLAVPIREGGGIGEWFWKGSTDEASKRATIECLVFADNKSWPLRYSLTVTSSSQERPEVLSETIDRPLDNEDRLIYYTLPPEGGASVNSGTGALVGMDVVRSKSILAQINDRLHFPEITLLREAISQVRFFGDMALGMSARIPQAADLLDDFLFEDGMNLGVILSDLLNRPSTKSELLQKLGLFYPRVRDLGVRVRGGTVQVYFHEEGFSAPVPARRLSDGTLHYLCLLAILLHPEPPPLVCIEEPELGLHPDAVSAVAELLIEASKRTQLIVTTHSDALVAGLSEVPEAVVVAERGDGGTSLRRLEPAKLEKWLEEYRLGDLWRMGELGGNRW
ncbi:MAG: AAA family ATPase [Acidobacteriota bacterium]